MYEPGLVEKTQTVQQLLCKDADQCRTQPSKLVLLDQFV